MTLSVSLGNWEQQMAAARAVRLQVFVIEQCVPIELEWDEMDAPSLHAVAVLATGEVVGTGRLLPDGHIGRMAVVANARGTGIGSLLLASLIRAAILRGDTCVRLSAQLHAKNFYIRHGFVTEGEEYVEAGIIHIGMLRLL